MNKIYKVLKTGQAVGENAKGVSGTVKKITALAVAMASVMASNQAVSAPIINEANSAKQVSIGYDISNSGTTNVAIGNNFTISGEKSLSIGYDSDTVGSRAIGIGNDNDSVDTNTIAVGNGNRAYKENDIAIGNRVSTAVLGADSPDNSLEFVKGNNLAVGNNIKAFGADNVSMGKNTAVDSQSSVAIGNNNQVSTNEVGHTIAIGSDNTTKKSNDVILGNSISTGERHIASTGKNIAIGNNQRLTSDKAIAVGNDGTTGGDEAINIGNKNNVDGLSAIGIGTNAQAQGENAVSFGIGSQATVAKSMAMGVNARAEQSNTVSLGHSTLAGGEKAVAIGVNAQANANETIALGQGVATGEQDIAIGANTSTSANDGHSGDNTAIGSWAKANGSNNTAVGSNAQVTGNSSSAVGSGVGVDGNNSAGFGSSVIVNADNAIGVGNNVQSYNEKDIVIGNSANTGRLTGGKNIVLGNNVTSQNQSNVVIGNDTNAGMVSGKSVAIGSSVAITKENSVGIGSDNNITNDNSVGVGTKVTTWSDNSVGIGAEVTAFGENSVVVGNNQAMAKGTNSVAMGKGAVAGTVDVVDKIETIYDFEGNPSEITVPVIENHSTDNISIGTNALSTSNTSTAIGKNAKAQAENSNVLGNNSTVTGANSTVIGNNSSTAETNSMVLGNNAISTRDNSVVLGNQSRDKGSTRVQNFTFTGVTPNVTTDDFAGSNPVGVVSVGDTGKERQIQHVASGALTATSTDAVNGSQLFAIANKLAEMKSGQGSVENVQQGENIVVEKIKGTDGTTNFTVSTARNVNFTTVNTKNATLGDTVQVTQNNKDGNNKNIITGVGNGAVTATSTDVMNGSQLHSTVTNVKDLVGGNATVDGNGKVTVTDIGGTGKSTIHEAVAEIGKRATTVTAGKNTVVKETTNANGGKNYEVALADNINVKSATVGSVSIADNNVDGKGNVKITGVGDGAIAVGSTEAVNGDQVAKLAKSVADNFGGGSTVNADGTVSNPTYNVAGGSYTNVGEALTALDNKTDPLAVKYTDDSKSTITMQGNGGTKITNVKAGATTATSTEAVNGSQLHNVANNVKNIVGGKTTINANGQVTTSDIGGTGKNTIDEAVAEVGKRATTVTAGDDITVTTTANENGGKNYQVALSKRIGVNSVVIGDTTTGKLIISDTVTDEKGNLKITGVGNGAVTATSTEATNGSQLYNAVDNVKDVIGGNTTINDNGKIVTNNIGGTGKNTIDEAVAEVGKRATTVTAGKNTVVTESVNANGGKNYQVAVADNINVKSATVGSVSIAETNKDGKGNVKITGVGDGTIAIGSTDVVNGDQVAKLDSLNVKYDNADKNSITLGTTKGTTKVTNVKAGAVTATSTDVINGSQLHKANTQTSTHFGGGSTVDSNGNITAPTYNVDNNTYHDVGSAIEALDNKKVDFTPAFEYTDKARKELAKGIASVTALETAPYVAGKLTYSVGAGHYNGESAVGVTLRKTADNGRWSVTGGVATNVNGGKNEPVVRIAVTGVID